MAIEIKSIPVLKGKAAARFIDKANKAVENSAKKSSVDFSKQALIRDEILAKAKL